MTEKETQEAFDRISAAAHIAIDEAGKQGFSIGYRNGVADAKIEADKEIEKLKLENKALKNRCHVYTRGIMCEFCNLKECEFKK